MSIVDLGPAAERLAGLVARADDSELGNTTPCPAYSLGDLIDHVGGLALAFTAAAKKERGTHVEMGPSGDASRLDLARATGQPYSCEPELLAAARSFLEQATSPDAPAGPDVAFGPPRQVPGDAPLLERVIALAGRDPGWSPGAG